MSKKTYKNRIKYEKYVKRFEKFSKTSYNIVTIEILTKEQHEGSDFYEHKNNRKRT